MRTRRTIWGCCDQIFNLRRLLTLIGVILLCLLIWFAGPYLAFAEFKPFASAVGRLIGILVVFVIWALVGQWRLWRTSRGAGARRSGIQAE